MHTNQYSSICFTLKDNAKTIREINCIYSPTRTKHIWIYDATMQTIIFNKVNSLNTYQDFINFCNLGLNYLIDLYKIQYLYI